MAESAVSFKASDGVELEGMLRQLPDATAACIVMHPHTQMGGNMQSHVVVAACRALQQLGVSSLRFNFRGAGGSGGSFDDGTAEQLDMAAALAFLRMSTGASVVGAVAYSFGTQVGLTYVSQHPEEVALMAASAPHAAPPPTTTTLLFRPWLPRWLWLALLAGPDAARGWPQSPPSPFPSSPRSRPPCSSSRRSTTVRSPTTPPTTTPHTGCLPWLGWV